MRRPKILLLAVTVALAGCATQAEVRAIVAESNAALVSPYLQRPGVEQPGGDQEAMARIDRLIEANPDDATLVAHLRVRQAMLPTVRGHMAVATEIWSRVDPAKLVSERDRTLFDVRKPLLFAYSRLSAPAGLNVDEKAAAKKHVATLTGSIEPSKERSLRIYLATVRALIEAKRADSMDEENEMAAIAALRESALAAFLSVFDASDLEWLQRNEPVPGTADVTLFRERIWLREVEKLLRPDI